MRCDFLDYGAQSVVVVWLSAKYVRTVACCGSQPSASVRLVPFVNAGHTLRYPVFVKDNRPCTYAHASCPEVCYIITLLLHVDNYTCMYSYSKYI